MAERIELPPEQHGTAEEQLAEIRSYLYRVATVLNVNQQMAGSETVSLTDEERVLMNNISKVIGAGSGGNDTYTPGGQYTEVETLKSLIIKTAQFVKTVQDNYNLILYGEESAEGSSGNWNRKKGLRVDITPDGIKQTFSYAEIIGGLKDYVLNSKSYVKSGHLRNDAQDQPVYGVAVGNDVTQFLVDGTEVYHDENKVAELTPNELGFYQSNKKVASYTGSKIEFLQNNQARLTIDGDGMVIKDPSGNTLAEFKDNEVVFFQGGNAVAEYKGNELVFMLQGKKRMIVDASGLTIQDANEVKLAELFGTGLVFYQDGVAMAAYTAANQQQQTPAQITFSENIVMPSNVSDEKGITLTSGTSQVLINPLGILLQSGGSGVLIDPTNITMDTPGYILLKGSGNSRIDFRDATNGVVLTVDKNGLATNSLAADYGTIENLTVKNLTANNIKIPTIIYGTTPPTGHGIIWLEPQTTGSQATVDDTVTISAAVAHSCPERARSTFTYRVPISVMEDMTGISTITISGTFNRQGQDQQTSVTVNAAIECSDGTTISLGTVKTISAPSYYGNYAFSKAVSYGGGAKMATGIIYTVSVADDFAHYSSFAQGTMRLQGQRTGQGSSDECIVHYIE